jgi:2,3-dihydroxyphenylpropionate 1,2-dioxygenase
LPKANALWSKNKSRNVQDRPNVQSINEEKLMSLAVVCASHTPLIYRGPASPETEQRVKSAFSELATWMREYNPDYIIQFAPDHFNGFFYDLMPSFCVGAGAESLGDWGGGTGSLPVPEATALELVNHLRLEDFDVAVSYRMPVDHGFVQMWEAMLGDFKSVPLIPIFVNGAAPPLPTYRRTRMLGEAVGRFAVKSGKRILFAASGGLSHDPPLADIRVAPPEVRERLINGRNPTPEAQKTREDRVLQAGVLAEAGQGPCAPLNPTWDGEFMEILRTADFARSDAFDTEVVRTLAGRGANEVLSWIAAFGALSSAGPYTVEREFYEAIPGWIAGMAMIAARQSGPASA